MANSYSVGQKVNFTVIFISASTGAYVDPTTITFKIRTPETALATSYVFPATIVKTAVGHYNVDYTLDFPGDWYMRWEGAGAHVGAKEWRVFIKGTKF